MTQAATDLAMAYCGRIAACAPLFLQVGYGDMATCVSRSTTAFTSTLTAPNTGWTAAAAEACASAIPMASCDDTLGNDLPAACHAPPGQLAVGAACGDGSQCASGYCNLGTSGKCGTCAAATGGAGAACYRDGDCMTGMTCVGANLNTGNTAATSKPTAGACATPGASGAACSAMAPCKATLACIGGTCTATEAAGASCTQDPDTFGACAKLAGDYCSAETGGTCKTLGTAAVSQACGGVDGTLTVCSAGGTCVVTGLATSGTCVAPAADFGNCVSSNGAGCLSPAQCVSGTCVTPTPSECH
jgi:hypothetical protein